MKLIFRSFIFVFSGISILTGYFLWSLKLTKWHSIRVFENQKIKFYHYGDIARVLYAYKFLVSSNRGFEYLTLRKFTSFLRKDSIVLDIGANIGLFSLLAAKIVNDQGKIYAFEPINKTFEILTNNLSKNGVTNVHPSRLALSNFIGKVSFNIPDDVVNKGDGDAFNRINFNDNSTDNLSDCTTLDSFLFENSIEKVDIIKIDIEGAELFCFEGATNLLSSKTPPVIVMECADSLTQNFGYSSFEVLEYLSKFGYSFEQYEFNQWLALPKHLNKANS